MNYSLLKKLIKKIEGEKIFLAEKNIKIFENLTESELNKLLSLNPKQFHETIKIILSFTKILNVSVYRLKLQSLTKILINNLENPNYKNLVQLLINTEIIYSNEILEFSRLFLTISDNYKLKTIKEVILANSNIDLISFFETIIAVNNHLKIDILKEIYIKSSMIYPYNFQELVSFVSNSSLNVLENLKECLSCNKLLKSSQIMTYLNYLKRADDQSGSKIWSVSLALSNEYMLESLYLKKVLNTIVNVKNEFYLTYIDFLVKQKQYISDDLFDKILGTIFRFTKDYQIETFLTLARDKEFISDYYKINLLTDYIKKANKTQAIYIKALIKQTEYLDNPRIVYILNMLINSDSATKLSSIVELVNYIINSENFFSILEIMNNIKNNLAFYYLKELIKYRPNLANQNIELIKQFVNLEFSYQMKFILHIIRSNKLNDTRCIKLIELMKFINYNQLKLVEIIIINTNISLRSDFMKYIEVILDIEEDYKIKILNEILLNNPNITHEKFNLVVNLIKKFCYSELKFVLSEVLNEVTPEGEKLVINQKRKIKKK